MAYLKVMHGYAFLSFFWIVHDLQSTLRIPLWTLWWSISTRSLRHTLILTVCRPTAATACPIICIWWQLHNSRGVPYARHSHLPQQRLELDVRRNQCRFFMWSAMLAMLMFFAAFSIFCPCPMTQISDKGASRLIRAVGTLVNVEL